MEFAANIKCELLQDVMMTLRLFSTRGHLVFRICLKSNSKLWKHRFCYYVKIYVCFAKIMLHKMEIIEIKPFTTMKRVKCCLNSYTQSY